MQKRSWLLLAGAFGAAILGVLLRWYQLARVYDPVAAMPRAGSLASLTLGLLPIVFIVFLCLLLHRAGKTLPGEGLEKLADGRTILTPFICAALGAVVCVSGILMLGDINSFPFPNLRQIVALFVIAAGIGIAVMSFLAKTPDKSIACPMFILPVACFCIYLIVFYKESQNDPVVWNYAVQILAIAANALSFFHLAGFVFHRPRPLHAVFFCLLAFAVSITCLADGLLSSEILLFAAMALVNLLFAVTILENIDRYGATPAQD